MSLSLNDGLMVDPRRKLYQPTTLWTIERQAVQPSHEKNNNGFSTRSDTNRPVQSQKIEARNFGFKKKRDCSIHVAKTKLLVSCAITAQLICTFVFAYTDCWFSYAVAQKRKVY